MVLLLDATNGRYKWSLAFHCEGAAPFEMSLDKEVLQKKS